MRRPCSSIWRAVVVVAFAVACASIDDRSPVVSSAGGASGNGNGNGGASNGGGSGSMSLLGGSGGSSVAGNGNASGSSGAAVGPCRGCVEITVPVTGPSQLAYFQLEFPEPGIDFSDGLITWRVKVPAGDENAGFLVQPFAQNGEGRLFAGLYENETALGADDVPVDEWWALQLDLSLYPPVLGDGGTPAFDRRLVRWVGIGVGSGPQFSGNGTVRVLLDSVTFAAVDVADVSFTSGFEGLTLNAFNVPPDTDAIFHP